MNKKLIEHIANATITETKKYLHCYNCHRSYDVTNMIPETIAEQGWNLYKPDKKYGAVLICNSCLARIQANR